MQCCTSVNAQNKLLDYLGCPKENLMTLRYRGDGWPGHTIAQDRNGKLYKLDYETSWGAILGRDNMKMCRVCLDGIGEAADISCGDAWYLTPDKKPSFAESNGRNVIFARTEMGDKILKEIIADGNIEIMPVEIDDLRYIQTYQYERRATMVDKILAMRLLGETVPKYKLWNLLKYSNKVSIKKHLSIFKGIVKRIIDGTI